MPRRYESEAVNTGVWNETWFLELGDEGRFTLTKSFYTQDGAGAHIAEGTWNERGQQLALAVDRSQWHDFKRGSRHTFEVSDLAIRIGDTLLRRRRS